MFGRLLLALTLSAPLVATARAETTACPPIPQSQTTAWAEGTWDVKQGDKDWFTVHIARAQFGVVVDVLHLSDTSWRPLRVRAVCDAPRQTMVLVATDVETAEELRITLGAAPGGLVGSVSGAGLAAPVAVTARRFDVARKSVGG